MNLDATIRIENLSKIYKLYNSPVDRLKESLHPLRRQYHHDFYALNDINFEIKKGESVGIIGKNGSGKSTLLKILTGVLTPTNGSVKVNGKVAALLELGAGFNPDLTGIENVFFNGMLMGYTREEMNERLDSILSFADIGEYVYQPVKTYSSGMFVRLAFAVATSVEPEILIVDEALSVGDAVFQQKCVKKMNGFKENGGNIVFVSHDMNAIKVLCQRAILLDKGKVIEDAGSEQVVNVYNAIIAQQDAATVVRKSETGFEHGNYKAKIIRVEMRNELGALAEIFVSGERVVVSVTVEALSDIEDCVVGILFRDRFGQDIYGCNSSQYGKPVAIAAGGRIRLDYGILLSLGCGVYTLTVATHSGSTHLDDNFHWCDSVKSFEIVFGEKVFAGLTQLETALEITYAQ